MVCACGIAPHPGPRPVPVTEQSSVQRAQRVADDQLVSPSYNPMGCAVRIPFLEKKKQGHECQQGLESDGQALSV